MSDDAPEKTLDERLDHVVDVHLLEVLRSSNFVMASVDRNIRDDVAMQLVAMLWTTARLMHKCGGSREKLLELALRAFEHSQEWDVHQEAQARGEN